MCQWRKKAIRYISTTKRPLRWIPGKCTSAADDEFRVLDAMLPYMTNQYGNPHSRSHAFGWDTEKACEDAREVCIIFVLCLVIECGGIDWRIVQGDHFHKRSYRKQQPRLEGRGPILPPKCTEEAYHHHLNRAQMRARQLQTPARRGFRRDLSKRWNERPGESRGFEERNSARHRYGFSNHGPQRDRCAAPAGGHPPQTQLLTGRAVFTELQPIKEIG